MKKALNFQQVIMRLDSYWAEQGCLVWQPYNTEVGAGTLNPATALRVLGPEPWHVGYLEPTARPQDGRYGENPNRWQQYYQYQVILKPDPGNPQELYLQSLEALGIDRARHDIRFVEDNWASPALGAWGLGWEVWLDGQEISQYTYFQQAGGIDLDPVAVEITYGVERIVMYLQEVDEFPKIDWNGTLTYGDVLFRGEVEQCKYNFDTADIDRFTTLYDLYEAEAFSALEHGLVIPAHNFVLKCSHAFNILDARGAVGVTERARFFGRMKRAWSEVAKAYLAQREEMGFPWLAKAPAIEAVPMVEDAAVADPGVAHDLLLEIGSEELPVGDQRDAIAQLQERVPQMLGNARLIYETIQVLASPRHAAVYVKGLAPSQPDAEEVRKGPPANMGYDGDGNPTKAAIGFARSNGVPVETLEARDFDGREYLVAVVAQKGRPTPDVLAEELPKVLGDLRFTLSMRWNDTQLFFSRPLRWLVALWGQQVISFSFAGVASGRVSRGLRPAGSPEFSIPSAEAYFEAIAAQNLVVDQDARRAMVAGQVNALATEVGGQLPDDPDLLDEVTNLVEYPTAILGAFDPAYLKLPDEVLIAVMKKHQRYFPLVRDGQLMPYFITVANGKRDDVDVIRHGNEEVLRARYADAAFFFEADSRRSLADYVPRLDTLTFQAKLGSMKDKADRLAKMVPALADMLGVSDRDRQVALRAAVLAKADLVTQMVIEHTSLQGVMGRYYAQDSGEEPAVAQAIEEHYWPRFSGDKLPSSMPATMVSIADRLDSLVGLFAVGLAPTGSADRYGLRRTALGLAQLLVRKGLEMSLTEAAKQAAEMAPVEVSDELVDQVVDFCIQRLRVWLLEEGYRYDLVDAALSACGDVPSKAVQALESLAARVDDEAFVTILTAYSRPSRITRDLTEALPLDPGLLSEPAEKRLYQAYQQAEVERGKVDDVDGVLALMGEMTQAIDTFFAEVFVMVEDEAVRTNRLALLQRIAALTDGIVDLTKVQGY